MSEKISSFKDLRVYKLAFEVEQEIFETSKRFPVEERYAVTDQIRRASRSIGANFGEAWQKRLYVAHFISKHDRCRWRTSRNPALVGYGGGVRLPSGARAKSHVREVLEDRSNAGNNDGKT